MGRVTVVADAQASENDANASVQPMCDLVILMHPITVVLSRWVPSLAHAHLLDLRIEFKAAATAVQYIA
jgi:hypothetical protein